MRDLEDYSRSRVLARVEHGGFSFGVVRQRINGKPWRKYIVLVYNGRAMSNANTETDPEKAAAHFKARFEHTYPPGGALVLADEIAKLLSNGTGQ